MAAGGGVHVVAGVVAGGDVLDPEAAGLLDQALELHLGVAPRAGDGRPAGEIVLHERRDHPLAERALEVDHVVGDAEPARDRPGVVQVLEGAAAAEGRRLALRLIVELHRHADDVVAGGLQQRGGDRRVHPPDIATTILIRRV